MAIYQVEKVSNLDEEILRDIHITGDYAVIRTGESTGAKKVWGFYKTAALATAAKRRWISREVVTR